eukprot:6777559-Pyramimonas_sp.AAC.1
MRNKAAAHNGLRLLLVTNHLTPAIPLIGFCEQYRLSTCSMDGWSSQSRSTSRHQRGAIVASTNARRLSGLISATAIRRAKR